jgi:5-oxopent-3-ene-1,2,5-tricarboxylate decarboxylase / 2-hydroxyhepta-2,4-diene-1,7-dioate isomerase
MASQYFPTGTVYGVLLNFSAERAALAAQMSQPPYKAPPQAPVLYIKTANTWSASGAPVPVPASVLQVEVGATVAMLVGPVSRYVLMNDLTIPHASFFRPPVKFKCLDGFLGVGSKLVTADDPASFKLEIRINGDLRQTVDFSNLVRSASTLLADVSEFMTLREGDVLMLGCDCLPGGGRPLAKAGDVIQISSPSHPALGVLVNTLVAETS